MTLTISRLMLFRGHRTSPRLLLTAVLATASFVAAQPMCEALPGAKCLYVHPTQGDDANPGTFAQPLLRPQIALWKALPGDVVYLRGGVYGPRHGYPVNPINNDAHCAQGVVLALAVIGTTDLQPCVSQAAAGAPGHHWTVASGLPGRPITLMSYPGERAIARNIGTRIANEDHTGGILIRRKFKQEPDLAYWNVRHLTLEGGGIVIAGGEENSAKQPVAQAHDIRIEGNEISQRIVNKGNIGLIKIGRGQFGGPYNITIENNTLHDLALEECKSASLCGDSTGAHFEWNQMPSGATLQLGGITTMSCDGYYRDPGECTGNGLVIIRNNTIYNVPAALYFKNPTKGPLIVEGNRIHDVKAVAAVFSASNVLFRRNIVYNVLEKRGFFTTAYPHDTVFLNTAKNVRIEYNTFAGINNLIEFLADASHHTIRNNVFFGLTVPASSIIGDPLRDDGARGLISRGRGYLGQYLDAPQIEHADIGQANLFNNNCFITAQADFRMFSRRAPAMPSAVQKFSLHEYRRLFGHELQSVVVHEAIAANVFTSPVAGDFRLKTGSPAATVCTNAGAHAAPAPPADTTPPSIHAGTTTIALSGSTTGEFSIATNEDSYCRFSRDSGVDFDVMPKPFWRTGRRQHTGRLKNLSAGRMTLYARCMDLSLNRNTHDFVIHLSVVGAARGPGPWAPTSLRVR